MKRRAALAALGTATVAFAGCLADGAGNPDSGPDDDPTGNNTDDPVPRRVDGEPARPECTTESEIVTVEYDGETREYETAETVPYPDAPTAFTEDDVVEFVEAFEHAYVTHDVLCENPGSYRVLDISYDVRTSETFDWYDDVTIVFLLRAGAASSMLHDDGSVAVADVGYSGVVYAVGESGAFRADFGDAAGLERDEFESHAPDPLEEGDRVAVFD